MSGFFLGDQREISEGARVFKASFERFKWFKLKSFLLFIGSKYAFCTYTNGQYFYS